MVLDEVVDKARHRDDQRLAHLQPVDPRQDVDGVGGGRGPRPEGQAVDPPKGLYGKAGGGGSTPTTTAVSQVFF